MKTFDYTTYLSPFSWRYGSDTMRGIWSEENKRRLWRKIWVALAKAQNEEGLISREELDDLIKNQENIDIEKAHEIEKDIQHDLMAEIKTYASQAKIGGGKLHLGATSMDIEDNADTIRIKDSLMLLEKEIKKLLAALAEKIEKYKDMPCMAYTHLQPAEPTTLGYRFSLYAQDIIMDIEFLRFVKQELKGKGIKGAVGTAASYTALLDIEKATKLEEKVMRELGIDSVTISSQTAPRKIEHFVAQFCSSLAQSLYKFAFDVRIMQSPGFSEWQEPFGEKQVGSSAMPFKRNPIKSEKICSLARLIFHLADVARDNASHMLLERTLDDSANRRVYLPEMFLSLDEIVRSATKIVRGLVINEKQVEKNLAKHAPFAATEKIMLEAVKRGANRQVIHEFIRENCIKAYEMTQQTDNNPLEELLANDKMIVRYINKAEITKLLDPTTHTGLAGKKSLAFVGKIKSILSD